MIQCRTSLQTSLSATWVARLAHLADIFNILNNLNLSLQGPDTNILKARDKVDKGISSEYSGNDAKGSIVIK